MSSPSVTDQLRPRVAARLGLADVVLLPASGGAGNLAFEVHDRAASGAPVAFLRCQPGDGGRKRLGYTLRREGLLLAQAAALGFPVAPVLGTFTDPDALLMGVVAGTSRPDPTEIEVVGPKYMALVAAIHAADSRHFAVPQHETMADAMAADLAMWKHEAVEREVMGDPLIALAARVLEHLAPPGPDRAVLVHGDVGAGNFMCLDGEVTAVLDWELAHLGDPHEDLAWMWMRGAHTDFGDPQRRLAEYQAASGRTLDRDRLAWHLALVMWKSVLSVHARLRSAVAGELAMVQLLVRLTYDALLGAQLVQLLGGSLPLLADDPELVDEPEANLAEELLGVATLAPDQRVVVEYLRDSAAQSRWERSGFERDCRAVLGIGPDELTPHIERCAPDALLPAATVVGRRADRRARAMPRAVRRIQRAQRIGLGASC